MSSNGTGQGKLPLLKGEPAQEAKSSSRGAPRILVVDDDRGACSALGSLLRDEGYETVTATNPFQALDRLRDFQPHVVLVDFRMPGLNGLELMQRVRAISPETALVMMTAYPSIQTAIDAVRTGAEFVEKPIDFAALSGMLTRVASTAQQLAESRTDPDDGDQPFIGEHASTLAVLELVRRVAPTRASVLLTGETGTGKGLIARMIHQQSPRADRPFVTLSCPALAGSVLESELFGHEKGAFTSAVSRREGRFVQADTGTLYLDEIGEISPTTQLKLLRILDDQEFERVGGNKTLRVDVRVIAATNRDLEAEVAAGRFRSDLFYRLNVVRIHAPPLRERSSDIPILAMTFLERAAKEHGKPADILCPEVLDDLAAYAWPGNVRELRHTIERLVVLSDDRCEGKLRFPEILPKAKRDPLDLRIPGSTLAEIEQSAILKALEVAGGDTARAAKMLGISRRKIQYRLRQYA